MGMHLCVRDGSRALAGLIDDFGYDDIVDPTRDSLFDPSFSGARSGVLIKFTQTTTGIVMLCARPTEPVQKLGNTHELQCPREPVTHILGAEQAVPII